MLGLGGSLVAVLFVSVASAGDVPLFERYPDISLERWQGDAPPDPLFGLEEREEATDVFKIWEVDLPDVIDDILQVLLVAAAVALAIALWNRRPRLRWRRARSADNFELLDDLATLVQADAAAQRSALATGSPRNAIVACWLRLEKLTAQAGLEQHPSDTSEEFTTRVLKQFSVAPTAAEGLAALYREARFSTHDMGERERQAALDALDVLHDGLSAGQAEASA